jgi:hypothetical protein
VITSEGMVKNEVERHIVADTGWLQLSIPARASAQYCVSPWSTFLRVADAIDHNEHNIIDSSLVSLHTRYCVVEEEEEEAWFVLLFVIRLLHTQFNDEEKRMFLGGLTPLPVKYAIPPPRALYQLLIISHGLFHSCS